MTLNSGMKMPILGYGVFPIGDETACTCCVVDAVQAGYRPIDTAASYKDDEAVGRGNKRCGVPRDQLFVTSKLWVEDAGDQRAQAAIDKSLKRLGLDHLDLFSIHQPLSDAHGAWRAMEEAHRADKLRASGRSNFQPDRLMDITCVNDVMPAVNQIEVNPFHQQTESVDFKRGPGVQPEAWAPLAECQNNLFANDTLVAIAQRNGKTVGQVVLRWLVQRGIVALAKSVRRERTMENIDVFDCEVSEEDMQAVATRETGESSVFSHRDPAIVKWMGERRLGL